MRSILNLFSQRDQSQNGQPRAAFEQGPTAWAAVAFKPDGWEAVVP
jgi:hypothetical protein